MRNLLQTNIRSSVVKGVGRSLAVVAPQSQPQWQPIVLLMAGGLSVLGGWGVQKQVDLNLLTPSGLQEIVAQAGVWGPLIYMGILAISVVVSQIPGVPLALVAGALWGPTLAGLYSVMGAFVGGLAAYFLGQTLGRTAIKAMTGKVISFSTQRGEAYIGWLIFITRLLPIFSFDLISYGAGITGLSWPIYASATFLGMIPSTFLLTYMGSTLTIGLSWSLGLAAIFLVVLVGLPWLMHRYNWFDVREIVTVA